HTRFSRDWSSDVCSSDLIVREFLWVTRFGFSSAFMRFFHLLTHRTDIVVFFRVVVQVFFAESLVFRLIMGVLLFVEGIVSYKRRSEERRVGEVGRYWGGR